MNTYKCIYPKIEIPEWEQIDQNMSASWPKWGRIDQNEYELTEQWVHVRIDQIDKHELTKMRTSWLEYKITGNRSESFLITQVLLLDLLCTGSHAIDYGVRIFSLITYLLTVFFF